MTIIKKTHDAIISALSSGTELRSAVNKLLKKHVISDELRHQLKTLEIATPIKNGVDQVFVKLNRIAPELEDRCHSSFMLTLVTLVFNKKKHTLLSSIENWLQDSIDDNIATFQSAIAMNTLTNTTSTSSTEAIRADGSAAPRPVEHTPSSSIVFSAVLRPFPVDEVVEEILSYLSNSLINHQLPEERADLPQQVFLRRLDSLSSVLASNKTSVCVSMAWDQTNSKFIIGTNASSKDNARDIDHTIRFRLKLLGIWCSAISRKPIDELDTKSARVQWIKKEYLSKKNRMEHFVGRAGMTVDAARGMDRSFSSTTEEEIHAADPSLVAAQHHAEKETLAHLCSKIAKIIDWFCFDSPSLSSHFIQSLNAALDNPDTSPHSPKIILPKSAIDDLGLPCKADDIHAEQLVMRYFIMSKLPLPQVLGISKLMCETCLAAHREHFGPVTVSGTHHTVFPNVPNILSGRLGSEQGSSFTPLTMERRDSDGSEGYSDSENACASPDRDTRQISSPQLEATSSTEKSSSSTSNAGLPNPIPHCLTPSKGAIRDLHSFWKRISPERAERSGLPLANLSPNNPPNNGMR